MPLLLLLVFVASIDPVPSPTPSPFAGGTALREIGRVRTSACPTFVRSANMAIMAALHNDVLVADAVRTLRRVQLDAGANERARGLHEVGALAASLRTQALRGEKEARHLHDLATRIEAKVRREGLLGFADALAGALERQQRTGRDLQVFIAHAEVIVASMAPLGAFAETPGPVDRAVRQNSYALQTPNPKSTPNFEDPRTTSLNDMAQQASEYLEVRRSQIDADEARAVESLEPAFHNCIEPSPEPKNSG